MLHVSAMGSQPFDQSQNQQRVAQRPILILVVVALGRSLSFRRLRGPIALNGASSRA
jgi:hypothetical protein